MATKESEWDIVVPNPNERVCYGRPEDCEGPDFTYLYEALFSRLGVRFPFTPVEQEVLKDYKIMSSSVVYSRLKSNLRKKRDPLINTPLADFATPYQNNIETPGAGIKIHSNQETEGNIGIPSPEPQVPSPRSPL
ncbi:hypothetical protein PIB30_090087 [Stylosanthes scabra]|uniref:Uncharacterized protein n=1 Tax=Stylosanthes scabra TaxID=79078 RepID=A0ABU6WVA3_9FABA|nr:hypothetical protein [Stylosanthes scabra]